ncbi:2-aminomuconic semialdehyde dehydrogenase-like [Oppia nitens]|uniref:2-aminomuconic semialdehyde dehydrogenase-like n=1 Tax=Oppia nitens TaxID=1686743 RepID=UPI0023DAE76F|nr:2-aminomuconic semialdehyde dehydrogenase-like [Oppia nitens]XP_054159342.1 2-aminomuconic semialdehyde dehydrogenase-like [Oppia nitens]
MSSLKRSNSVSDKTIEVHNYIDGKFEKSDNYFNSYNPAVNRVNAFIPDSNERDVQRAVSAAKRAFESWSKTSVQERSQILNKVAMLIELSARELAQLESWDQGKPLWLATTLDIPRAAHNFRHFANAILYDTNISITDPDAGVINYTTHEPIGVAGIITPWNLPLYLLTFKLAPALAYGNTVVAKPSELTSVTAYKLCHLLEEAGLPPGVVNMVFGLGQKVGEPIVEHPDVPIISFTGSTATGARIAQRSAPLFKKLSLEMGGKNAAIIFDDINLDTVFPQIIRSCFLNSGEICLASSRLYVQKSIYQVFVDRFTIDVLQMKVGDPTNNDTLIGPMISSDHQKKVLKYIELARNEGATVRSLPFKLDTDHTAGYYVSPTVITDISDDSACMREEIFGPVVCVVPFDTQDEVVTRANNSPYGLSASVWSSNVDRVHTVANRLRVGTVWCNCWLVRNLNMPFGGQKQSGTGREATLDSREFYTEKKTICIKTNKK